MTAIKLPMKKALGRMLRNVPNHDSFKQCTSFSRKKNTPPMLRFPPPPYLFKLLKNTSPSPLKKIMLLLQKSGDHHLRCIFICKQKNTVNSGINYQPQLVFSPDFWLPSKSISLHRFSPNSCLPSQANPSPISHRWSNKKRFHLSKDPGTAPRFLLRNWRMPTKVTKILWGWLSVMKFFFKEKTQQTVVTFFKMIVRYISKQLKRLPSLFVNACQAYFLRKNVEKSLDGKSILIQ